MAVLPTALPVFDVGEHLFDIQATINLCHDAGGGIVYVPPRSVPYLITNPLTLWGELDGKADIAIHLVGDGPERSVILTNVDGIAGIQVHSSHSTVENLTVQGRASTSDPTNFGIVIGSTGTTLPAPITGVRVIRCVVRSASSYGIVVSGGAANTDPTLVSDCALIQSRVRFAFRDAAIQCRYVSRIRLERCFFDYLGFAGTQAGPPPPGEPSAPPLPGVPVRGVLLDHCAGVTLDNCTFDNDAENGRYYSASGQTWDNWNSTSPFVEGIASSDVLLNHCWFEEHLPAAQTDYEAFVVVGDACAGWTIDSCSFTRAQRLDARAIRLNAATGSTTPCAAVAVLNPFVSSPAGVPTDVDALRVANPESDCTVLGGIVLANKLTSDPFRSVTPLPISANDPHPGPARAQNVLLGVANRVRLTRVQDPTTLPNPQPGSVVYNTSTDTVQILLSSFVWANVEYVA